jgi:4-amino-4-deoxy-L-arabinose transferase-like glycosyltransferase
VLRLVWLLRPLTAVAVVGIVALPWYIAVGLRTDGLWLEGFLGQHNVGRFLKPLEGHGGPIFYYLGAIAVGFFPWSIFLPLGLFQLWRRLREARSWSAGDLFLACWAGTYIGFFSLASTKLPSYILPAYPALALLTARGIEGWLANPQAVPRWLLRVACGTLAAVGIGLLGAAPYAARHLLQDEARLGWVGLVPLVGAIVMGWCLEHAQPRRAATAFSIAAILFVTTLFGGAAVQVSDYQTSADLMQLVHTASPDTADIGSFGYFRPSLAFYAREPVKRLKSAAQVVEFLKSSNSAYLVIRDRNLPDLQPSLPAGIGILARRREFLKSRDLLLLGPIRQRVAARPISMGNERVLR